VGVGVSVMETFERMCLGSALTDFSFWTVQPRDHPDLRTADDQQSAALSEIFLYVVIVA